MIMLVLIVNITFVVLAVWFIVGMGEGRPREGDRTDSLRRLTDRHGSNDKAVKDRRHENETSRCSQTKSDC